MLLLWYVLLHSYYNTHAWADPEGGGAGGLEPPENHRNIGVLSNSGPDPLKNHKDHHRHAWRADDGPILVVFGSTH